MSNIAGVNLVHYSYFYFLFFVYFLRLYLIRYNLLQMDHEEIVEDVEMDDEMEMGDEEPVPDSEKKVSYKHLILVYPFIGLHSWSK